jgi:hypothetical protein
MINLIALIFGQCGPINLFSLFNIRLLNLMQRTICKKFLNILFYSISFRTNIISNFIKNSVLVKYYLIRNNPQITKARNYLIHLISKSYQNNIFIFIFILQTFIYNFKFNIKYLIKLSMWVGISETISFFICQFYFLYFNFNLLFIIIIISFILGLYLKLNLNFINNYLIKNIIFLINVNYSSLLSFKNLITFSNNKKNVTNNANKKKEQELFFSQWLSGLIDGCGCFKITKKEFVSLDIIIRTIDKHCLYQIKQKFGGSIKLKSDLNWLRYKLHHKKGLLNLINAVNGEIRNPIRLIELNKICEKYNIQLIQPSILSYNNGWFSGFFDSIGNIELIQDSTNKTQLLITVLHKNKYLLTPLIDILGGNIIIEKEIFKWVVSKKQDILQILNYFKVYPIRTTKITNLMAIKKYYELISLKADSSTPNSILGKCWKRFQIKFLSRSYSTNINSFEKQIITNLINPWYVTGLTDAEGCFSIVINKNKLSKTNYNIQPYFIIHINEKDLVLLEKIKLFFNGVGYISKKINNCYYYRVSSIHDLNFTIIPHFLNYPLLTQKQNDFKLFKLIIDLMIQKKHLTKAGINKIVSIKASINLGLSKTLKSDFSKIKPIPRPLSNLIINIEPYWLSGFVNGDGCFSITIYKDKTKTGFTPKLTFQITQHSKDTVLMNSLINFFNCGLIKQKSVLKPAVDFTVTKFIDIDKKIIPFFNKYPLYGIKELNFRNFCKAAAIIKSKTHLTKEGIEKIRNIKSTMNQKSK